ncbi:nudix hydrolase 20, chloroplastic-like isoform X1, partial [Argonauta hians]
QKMEHEPSCSGFLSIITRCNRMETSELDLHHCLPFVVEGCQVGLIPRPFWSELEAYSDVFYMESSSGGRGDSVHLQHFQTVEERSRRMESVLQDLRGKKVFKKLDGWRNEEYQVKPYFNSPNLMNIERSAVNIFGIPEYGTHLNGYTCSEEGEVKMWIGRRSDTKPTWPGKLDNLSAGGLSSNMSAIQCMRRECEEEAGITGPLLDKLVPTGSVTYMYGDKAGLHAGTQFIYDLCLPSHFVPHNADGEMSHFYLMGIEELKEKILEDDFKPNCALVILDFLIRRGFITPDTEPNYLEMVEMLHRPLQHLFRDFQFWSRSDVPRYQ